jgi:hypothetical protein
MNASPASFCLIQTDRAERELIMNLLGFRLRISKREVITENVKSKFARYKKAESEIVVEFLLHVWVRIKMIFPLNKRNETMTEQVRTSLITKQRFAFAIV